MEKSTEGWLGARSRIMSLREAWNGPKQPAATADSPRLPINRSSAPLAASMPIISHRALYELLRLIRRGHLHPAWPRFIAGPSGGRSCRKSPRRRQNCPVIAEYFGTSRGTLATRIADPLICPTAMSLATVPACGSYHADEALGVDG
ncbi:hypothetical protein KM043_002276 [Ampulex compressa]|nr:hypothetical protein KM043_002276 [Ampulex compressa]